MSEARLDPDSRPTVLQMMDANTKLDRVKISAADAIAWAKKNNVNLDDPGDAAALINTARAQRNLPLFDMSPHPKTLLVPAPAPLPPPAQPTAPEKAKSDEVDMSVALKWAKAERIVWNRVQPIIEQINDARKGWGLPPFRSRRRTRSPPIIRRLHLR